MNGLFSFHKVFNIDMFNNFMERNIILIFVFVLMMGFVFAAEDWGDINSGELGDGNLTGTEGDLGVEGDYIPVVEGEFQGSEGGKFYTSNFYIALGIGVFVLIAVGLVIWLLIRGPKNKWE